MPDDELQILDEDSLRRVAESVRELHAKYKNVREFMANLRREPYGHVVRTVKTSTRPPDFVVYPDAGAVFPFQFEDWDFEEVAGASGIDNADEWPAKKPIGQVWGGRWVPEGTRLIAVKVTSATKGRQWWGFPIPQPLIRFELTETLCAAVTGTSSAAAVLIDEDLAQVADSPAIEVHDTVGFWHGLSGYQGWAVWQDIADHPSGGRYEILYLEALARFVEFTLDEDMTTDCSVEGYGDQPRSAIVNRYWGSSPNGKDPAPGGVLDVYDRAELFPLALEGAKGFAIYDEAHATEIDQETGAICRGRYVVVQCDQQCLWMEAQVTDDFCCDDELWDIEGVLEGTAAPFGQRPNPEPEHALNIYGLAAQSGDRVCVLFSHLYCDWIVLQVAHKCLDVVVGLRMYDPGTDCQKLQLATRQIAVPYCDPDIEWPEGPAGAASQQLALSSVDVVTGLSFTGLDGDTANFNSGECALSQTVRRVCLLDTSAGPADPRTTEVMQFTEVDVVVDVFDTGTALSQTLQSLYVACAGVSASEGIISTTDCDEGTG